MSLRLDTRRSRSRVKKCECRGSVIKFMCWHKELIGWFISALKLAQERVVYLLALR